MLRGWAAFECPRLGARTRKCLWNSIAWRTPSAPLWTAVAVLYGTARGLHYVRLQTIMRAGWISLSTHLAFLVTLAGCSGESRNPVHQVNERLVVSLSELSDEIEKAISRHVEASYELGTCEKNAKNVPIQCAESKVTLARTVARLCGLQTQRAMLHKIIENGGDARSVKVKLGESCEFD